MAIIITIQEQITTALVAALHASSSRSSQGRHLASETVSVVAVHLEVDLTGGVAVETAADPHPIETKIAAHMETVVTTLLKNMEVVALLNATKVKAKISIPVGAATIVEGVTRRTAVMTTPSEIITRIAIEMTTDSTPAIRGLVMIKKTIAEGGASSKEARRVIALLRMIASKIRARARMAAGRTTGISREAETVVIKALMWEPQRKVTLNKESPTREKAIREMSHSNHKVISPVSAIIRRTVPQKVTGASQIIEVGSAIIPLKIEVEMTVATITKAAADEIPPEAQSRPLETSSSLAGAGAAGRTTAAETVSRTTRKALN